MSCSKPLPPFTYDLLSYLNRDQLERFSIVCRPPKNFINRYFHSKQYRVLTSCGSNKDRMRYAIIMCFGIQIETITALSNFWDTFCDESEFEL